MTSLSTKQHTINTQLSESRVTRGELEIIIRSGNNLSKMMIVTSSNRLMSVFRSINFK